MPIIGRTRQHEAAYFALGAKRGEYHVCLEIVSWQYKNKTHLRTIVLCRWGGKRRGVSKMGESVRSR